MRIDLIEMQRAARRHRAEVIGGLIAAAFGWLLTRGKHASRVRHVHTLAKGW